MRIKPYNSVMKTLNTCYYTRYDKRTSVLAYIHWNSKTKPQNESKTFNGDNNR